MTPRIKDFSNILLARGLKVKKQQNIYTPDKSTKFFVWILEVIVTNFRRGAQSYQGLEAAILDFSTGHHKKC